MRTFGETIPPMPTASAFSSTTTRSALASAARTASSGNGRNERDARRQPIRTPSLAQLVDDVLDRAEHRAERDDDRLGVVGAVAADQPAGVAAERAARSRAAISGIRSSACICLSCARYWTSVNASGPTIAPIEIGSSGSSTWRGSNGGRNASTCSCVGDVDALDGVGEDEAVHAHHHRQRQLLGEPERLDVQVDRLLVGLRVELDPAASRAGTSSRSGRSRC